MMGERLSLITPVRCIHELMVMMIKLLSALQVISAATKAVINI